MKDNLWTNCGRGYAASGQWTREFPGVMPEGDNHLQITAKHDLRVIVTLGTATFVIWNVEAHDGDPLVCGTTRKEGLEHAWEPWACPSQRCALQRRPICVGLDVMGRHGSRCCRQRAPQPPPTNATEHGFEPRSLLACRGAVAFVFLGCLSNRSNGGVQALT